MSKYKQALLDIYAAMGPSIPTCIKCSGCRVEWNHALACIEETIGKEELSKVFPWKRIIKDQHAKKGSKK